MHDYRPSQPYDISIKASVVDDYVLRIDGHFFVQKHRTIDRTNVHML